jgi:hypothetical protein
LEKSGPKTLLHPKVTHKFWRGGIFNSAIDIIVLGHLALQLDEKRVILNPAAEQGDLAFDVVEGAGQIRERIKNKKRP